MKVPASQRGTALVTALLVLTMTAALTADMAGEQQFDLRRTGNLLAREQAREVALGGERWAVAILARDRRGEARSRGQAPGSDGEGGGTNNPEVDSLDENWAQPLPPVPAEGGQIAGEIIDLQARFNLNNLISNGAVDALALSRFERLLQALEIDRGIARAVTDWIDADSETTFPGGAEDDFYIGRDAPYLAANRPLASVTELRQVRGIDAETWRRLRPHVTALPGTTAINVNTAGGPVLQALSGELEAGVAEQLSGRAREQPYQSVDAFLGQDVLAGLDINSTRLAVGSGHFRLRAVVLLGQLEYTLYSWLQREDNGALRVLRRARRAD